MEIIKDIYSLQQKMTKTRHQNKKIGLVPTMGFLHAGHTSLIESSVKECDVSVVSIFVNPAQFGKGEDFEKYPRDEKRDTGIIKKTGADFIFIPSAEEMYGKDYQTFVNVRKLSRIMCGKYRPGHFEGVCTVVLKLINISLPEVAYFGLKDYQQFLIIKKMAEDLDLAVKIQGCPIVREKDGLALSSRNKYLSPQERENATALFKAINLAADMIKSGVLAAGKIKKAAINFLESNSYVKKIDYFDLRDAATLDEIKSIERYLSPGNKKSENKILIAAAVWIGGTRLIDNIII